MSCEREPPVGAELVVSDVDGTLVTSDKRVTPAAVGAVGRLRAAGLKFTLISSRPPRGMRGVAEALGVDLPMAAFNGGAIFAPDLTVLEAHRLEATTARVALDTIRKAGVEVWVYAGDNWLVEDPNGLRVDREQRAVGFGPTVVTGFEDVIGRIDKIVGVSEDHALLARLGAEIGEALAGRAEVQQSQAYYLDVTHPRANKGDGVRALCRRIGAPPGRTAVIGDMFNDVAMFRAAGFSVAMGQSPDRVKAMASAVSPADEDADGFARAAEDIILPRALGAAA